MPRASGASMTPARARWYGASDVTSLPVEETVPLVGASRPAVTAQSVDFPAPFAPSRAIDRALGQVQRHAVEHLDVAVPGHDRRRVRARRPPRATTWSHVPERVRSPTRARRCIGSSSVGARAGSVRSPVRAPPSWTSSLGPRDPRQALLLPPPLDALAPDEREQPVGVLRQVDRAEAEQDGGEVRRAGQVVEPGRHEAPARDPVEDRASWPSPRDHRAAPRPGGGSRTSPRPPARGAR